MTDDQWALAAKLDRLSADAARLAEEVRRLGRAGDRIDDLGEGARLSVRQAATICSVTDQAIYNWIEDAKRMRRPIAEKYADVWVIVTSQLLAFVEKHRGGPASRVEAESQLKECWPVWSQELHVSAKKRSSG
jgi:hypothetical protein